jgi:hypothetical protein
MPATKNRLFIFCIMISKAHSSNMERQYGRSEAPGSNHSTALKERKKGK